MNKTGTAVNKVILTMILLCLQQFQFYSSIPIFLRGETVLKPKEQKPIKIEVPFLDEISGLAIIKLLDMSTKSTIMLKVKFTQNIALLDMTNSSSGTLILSPKEALGILDLRSLGYYNI